MRPVGIRRLVLADDGFRGDEPHIPKPVKLTMVDDKRPCGLNCWRGLEIGSLKRILVSHGSPIDDHPGQALRDLAASL